MSIQDLKDRAEVVRTETVEDANSSNRIGQLIKDIADQMVSDSEDQTIAGVKTFSSSPVVPAATGDTDAQNKAGVEAQITARQEAARSQSTAKSPTSKLVDDELSVCNRMIVGKNKFNSLDADIVRGEYLRYGTSGNTANTSFSITGYIPILAGQTMYCNTASETNTTICHRLYDSNKTKLSDVNIGAVKSVTASQNGFVRFSLIINSTGSLGTTQVEIGTSGTTYEAYELIVDKSKIKEINETAIPSEIERVASVDAKLLEYAKLVVGKNKFNALDADFVNGEYLRYGTSGNTPNASYSITGYIPILAGQTMYCNTAGNATDYVCHRLYDSNKAELSDINSGATVKSVTASQDGFVRFSINTSEINTTQVEIGTSATTYEIYQLVIDTEKLGILPDELIPDTIQRVFTSTQIICKRYGTVGIDCDFTGLNAVQQALDSITDASSTKVYTILFEGQFLFTSPSELLMVDQGKPEEFSAIAGKDYVNIEGLGKDKSIIAVEFPIDTVFPSGKTSGDYQPVMWNCNSTFKNAAILAYNCRYAVHFEGGNAVTNKTLNFENCYIGYKGAGSAFGTGMRDGQVWNIKNCELYSLTGNGFAVHSALNTTVRGGEINLIDCIFDCGSIVFSTWAYERNVNVNIINPTYKRNNFAIIIDDYRTSGSISANHAHFKIKSSNLPVLVFNSIKYGLGLRIKSKSTGTGSTVRFDQTSTAFNSIIGNSLNAIEELTNWLTILQYGYEYKSGGVGLSGYAIGWNDIDDGTTHTSLGKKLGDCSSVNKTLTVIVDGTSYNVVFNTNMTDSTNDQVIALITAVIGTVADVDTYAVGCEYYPDFKGMKVLKNMDNTAIIAGMGCNSQQNSADNYNPNCAIRATNASGRCDYISLDSIAPGQLGRFIPKGSLICSSYANTRFKILDVIPNSSTNEGIELGISTTQPGYFDRNASPKFLRSIYHSAVSFF